LLKLTDISGKLARGLKPASTKTSKAAMKFRKELQAVKNYIPGKPIEEVQRELGLRDVIKLASNESPYGPSPKVLKAIAAAAGNLNRYPESDCYYLRKAQNLGYQAPDEYLKALGVK